MPAERAVIIGAGIGGLAAAIGLAARGLAVEVVEAAAAPGGKLRTVRVGDAALDAGPTVFTMRDVFEELFADAGAAFGDHVTLEPLTVLARHAWSERERLDLFADPARSAEAIGDMAGAAEARGFLAFCARSRAIFETLDRSFMRVQRPTPIGLVASRFPLGLAGLLRIAPFATMWSELGRYVRDPRLRQLFARYATYCGSSPFAAPATLMLVAHAEQRGVWSVAGGMHRLAAAMAGLAERNGARFRYGARAAEVVVRGGCACGVRLSTGDLLSADVVVSNADAAVLASGLLGRDVVGAAAPIADSERSLSAVTWLVHARDEGFPLVRHNVFFSGDYRAEFDDILGRGRLPADPTVYVCAQDRGDGHGPHADGPERLMVLVNAPAIGDRHPFDVDEVERCRDRTFRRLESCGLRLGLRPEAIRTVTPADFNRLFPATGGALYGRATHGPMASFRRDGSRSRIPGLYLAGGSVHPGPGVPMAALSGRLAAQAILADLASMRRSRPAATPGGTSMRSATTAGRR